MSTTTADRPGRSASWLGLVPFLLAVAVVAVLGGLASASAAGTYRELELPWFAPPSWVFGPVWTILYVTIGVAGWLVWRRHGWDHALTWWTAQLVLNLAWTPLFFALGLYGWALVEIILLLVAVLATIVSSWRVSRAAALLLVPYACWVGFAMALNSAIVRLN